MIGKIVNMVLLLLLLLLLHCKQYIFTNIYIFANCSYRICTANECWKKIEKKKSVDEFLQLTIKMIFCKGVVKICEIIDCEN